MGLIDELWEHSQQTSSTRVKPRKGYIDAGIVLVSPAVFYKNDLVFVSEEELNEFAEVLDRVSNLELEQELETNKFLIFNEIPVITSLGA